MVARYKVQTRETAYRNYVTDALYVIADGGRSGIALAKRFADIFEPKKVQKEDTRTQEEIVAAVWAGITGKKVVNE